MPIREIRIRPGRLDDADAIWGIYHAAIPQTTRNDNQWEKILRQGGMFLAEMQETAIGFGGIDLEAIEQIRYVYVNPEYQRSGLRVGLRILQTLEAAARQKGIEVLRLHSTPNAVGFYEKAGYSAVETEHLIGHDHPGVEMVKTLVSQGPSLSAISDLSRPLE